MTFSVEIQKSDTVLQAVRTSVCVFAYLAFALLYSPPPALHCSDLIHTQHHPDPRAILSSDLRRQSTIIIGTNRGSAHARIRTVHSVASSSHLPHYWPQVRAHIVRRIGVRISSTSTSSADLLLVGGRQAVGGRPSTLG
ncbi:hypothetical protein HAX54_024999 [Datura stramonium]|uniref:Uncharacterized protein n=1 Tax=Datura stramonium TaxID=4076 RepID=A0ABS8UYQ3_DATST|nr:hypothetical protein [Datura stramonium]